MIWRSVLAAGLIWAVVVCAVLATSATTGAGRSTLVLLAAASALLTLALALSHLPSTINYLIAHLSGVAAVVVAIEGPRPPWAWHATDPLPIVWRGGPLHQETILLLLSLGLTWELTYACTWLVVRERRSWLALALIVGAVAFDRPLAGLAYDRYLLGLCAAGLGVILATASLERQQLLLRRLHTAWPERLAPLLLIPLVATLIAGAWIAPLPPAAATAALRHGDLRGALTTLLTRVTTTTQTVSDDSAASLSGFSSTLAVRGTFHPDGAPVLEAVVADPGIQPYWRGAVYDRYLYGTWQMVPTRAQRRKAGANLPQSSGSGAATVITATVRPLRPLAVALGAGPPLSLSLPVDAMIDGAGRPLGALSVIPATGQGTTPYFVRSLAAPTGVRTTTPTLDPRVRALDLSVPVLPLVAALARRIVAPIPGDPYRRAWAIQTFLRAAGGATPYRYDTSPPAVPAGDDPTAYFLLQGRRGFCTQFASAMVLLARYSGIPARLVTGFASGQLIDGIFHVTTADAHAWPELWIAGRGWITFEPTPPFATPFALNPLATTLASGGRPTLPPLATLIPTAASKPTTANGGTAAVLPSAAQSSPYRPTPHGSGWQPHLVLPTLPPALPIAALGLLLLAAIGRLALRTRPDIGQIYTGMCRQAARLRAGPRHGQTPLEWATQVATRDPSDAPTVLMLTRLYVHARYSGQPLRADDERAARLAWRALNRRWLWRWLLRRPL